MKPFRDRRGIAQIVILIALGVVAVGSVGWVSWNAWQSNKKADDASVAQPEPQGEETDKKETDEYAGWKTYAADEEKLSLRYPDNWKLEGNGYSSDKTTFSFTLASPDIATKELGIGGTDVTKGAQVRIYTTDSEGKTLEQIYNTGLVGQLVKNGSVKPVKTTIAGYKAVEYTLAYEGPEHLTVLLLIGGDRYLGAVLTAEDDEKTNKNYAVFRKILNSIKVE